MKLLISMLAFITLSGCYGSLKVQFSVLEPEYVVIASETQALTDQITSAVATRSLKTGGAAHQSIEQQAAQELVNVMLSDFYAKYNAIGNFDRNLHSDDVTQVEFPEHPYIIDVADLADTFSAINELDGKISDAVGNGAKCPYVDEARSTWSSLQVGASVTGINSRLRCEEWVLSNQPELASMARARLMLVKSLTDRLELKREAAEQALKSAAAYVKNEIDSTKAKVDATKGAAQTQKLATTLASASAGLSSVSIVNGPTDSGNATSGGESGGQQPRQSSKASDASGPSPQAASSTAVAQAPVPPSNAPAAAAISQVSMASAQAATACNGQSANLSDCKEFLKESLDADASLIDVGAVAGLASKTEIDNTLTSYQGIHETLDNDSEAYWVTTAPDRFWAQRYDYATGSGQFGDVNIAIRYDPNSDSDSQLGHVSVKGLTFDPSQVARVASKTVVQSLLLAAQLQGVPMGIIAPASSKNSNDASAAGSVATSNELDQKQQATLLFEAERQDAQKALLAVAMSAIGQHDNLANADDDEIRASAAKLVKAAFDANAARIAPPSLQPSSSPK